MPNIIMPNIIDYSYIMDDNILFVLTDKQLWKVNITTRRSNLICDITNVRYINYISDDELYCMKDNSISILNIKTMNEFDVWKPIKNKKIKYGCKPLLIPNYLLVPINNGNKIICIETNTHIISKDYKRSFDCILQFGDISEDNILITLYKNSIDIRNTNNINQVIYRFEKKDIPIPIPLTETYKYNISIIGNYSFIRIYEHKKMIYYGLTINLSNYKITKHNNYILKENIFENNYTKEKIFYILPYNTKDEIPNMFMVYHKYFTCNQQKDLCYGDIGIGIVSMKND